MDLIVILRSVLRPEVQLRCYFRDQRVKTAYKKAKALPGIVVDFRNKRKQHLWRENNKLTKMRGNASEKMKP